MISLEVQAPINSNRYTTSLSLKANNCDCCINRDNNTNEVPQFNVQDDFGKQVNATRERTADVEEMSETSVKNCPTSQTLFFPPSSHWAKLRPNDVFLNSLMSTEEPE